MNEDLRRMNVLQTLDELAHHDGCNIAQDIIDEWRDKNPVSDYSAAITALRESNPTIHWKEHTLSFVFDSKEEMNNFNGAIHILREKQNEGDQT